MKYVYKIIVFVMWIPSELTVTIDAAEFAPTGQHTSLHIYINKRNGCKTAMYYFMRKAVTGTKFIWVSSVWHIN